MHFNDYMRETFPNFTLRPPLFYRWKVGIRFELGVNYTIEDAYENSPYLQGVYRRAITLFKALHAENDDLYIIVDADSYSNGQIIGGKLKVFSRYVKEKSVLYRLTHKTIPNPFSDNEESDDQLHRFTLKCKTSNLRVVPMLKAICNNDMGIRPSIPHRVYFININRKTIFHVYDDRGCDLIAAMTEAIREVYNKYNDWILDYDRSQIDRVFKSGYKNPD